MAPYGKTAARETVDAWNATLQIEHLVASVASKVMVVRLAGSFVNVWRPGKVNCGEPAFFQQPLDVPVDRCDPEAIYICVRRIQHLSRR